ncbi:hypothetical protein K2173_024363 [Erythroxylum novogranatense]|uniref:Cation/H+ exchanger domain-containing protein n=1 Tax=Erythroxylum novogranatense TaxID=1862640 RepID=A0AAV8SUC5_9ROSI|nr:hypothetical protein K2173_024363 [Erythroxylum novogranatense]
MDAASRAMCTDDLFNPIITIFVQSCGMLVVSHIFHLFLKPLGQPGPIAQILAGLVLGPSLLCRIKTIRDVFIQPDVADYGLVTSFIFRIFFIFTIGLEMDIPYSRRNFRQAAIIAIGGIVSCSIFGVAASVFVISMLKISAHEFVFCHLFMIILASSASPVVIRLASELKFDTSDVGRLAISTSLMNEMCCVLWYSIAMAFTSTDMLGYGFLCLFVTLVVVIVNRFFALWTNRRKQNQKYVSSTDLLIILFLVLLLSFFIEGKGYNSTISCFLVGVMFPREGKTTRTLLPKLDYAVNNIILPIYFGFSGFRCNLGALGSLRNFIVVAVMILLSIGGKIIGTLAACHYLNIPRNEGLVLAFILNLKGHSEFLLIDVIPKDEKWWDTNVQNLVILVVMLNTVISGPVVSLILRREANYFSHRRTTLEFHDPESELRMLICVHGCRHISAKLGLISALSGSQCTPSVPYLMHLVELPKERKKTKLMYHELQDGDQFSDEEEYGGNDEVEINDMVDAFTAENKVLIHQSKTVSSFAGMDEDVCTAAEDLRVSIVFLIFHKHQRLDGQLESGKDELRVINQKVIRHAPCSVGVFVDRGQTGFQQPGPGSRQDVAMLYFGGPDDREALACSKKIVAHPHINLTIIRFSQASSKEQHDTSIRNSEDLKIISSSEVENAMDTICIQDFCSRYVATGQASYIEKYVNNGAETVEALREIVKKNSLFIVGKGGRGLSPLTTNLSDWEECPELGTVGDLLASSELDINGSVLVIQQHRHSRKHHHFDI